MPNLKTDKFQRLFVCGLFAGPLAISLGLAQKVDAADQIAQAIPPVTPTGIYAKPVPGVLGQAIDQASAEPNSNPSSESGSSAISLPRIDAHQDSESKFIAQAAAQNNDDSPVDLAPVKLPERTSSVFQADQFKTGLLYKLPARMFLFSTIENSLREETNVFQTLHNNKSDMIYRVLPNVTVGYALTKTTRVSANYFYLRDQYTHDAHTLSRNIHSIGGQINQDIPITSRTAISLGFMARQLLLSRSQPLSDLLPSINVTHRVGSNTVLYGGLLGQIRFRNTLGKFQEGDPFYTLGGVYRTPRWLFLWDNTLVTSYGNRRLRFGPDNGNMIMTFEADYKLSRKLPIVAFLRAQPIFNIGANQAQGFAGFNFRIFGGLRVDINKAPVFPTNPNKRK